MKNRIVFLSGKVTGLPRWWTVLKFMFWDLFLTFAGYDVFNPVFQIPKKTSHLAAMKMCLSAMQKCNCIFMVPGWTDSKGAQMEFKYASRTGKILLNTGWIINVYYKYTR